LIIHAQLMRPPVEQRSAVVSAKPSEWRAPSQFEVIENGESFYAAELDAMRHAQRSINIEAYIIAGQLCLWRQ
jgi:phosphatidylserine/phosphatidylglycerophosphate/cardiolipin synthase-like enzyme